MKYSNRERKHRRIEKLNTLISDSDIACRSELRMNRCTFNALCKAVRDIKSLTRTKNMPLEEIASMFLYTLAHKLRTRTIGNYFIRSGECVSRPIQSSSSSGCKTIHAPTQKACTNK